MSPTYTFPPETALQKTIWCSWPGNPDTWSMRRKQALSEYAHLVATISHTQPVDLICPLSWQADASQWLEQAHADCSRITYHPFALNDAWCRDHGGVFLHSENGPVVLDLPYNAWGGKFSPWDADDRIALQMAETRGVPHLRFPFCGEGGALEMSPSGILLTTTSVWLNPNRNQTTRSEMEAAFAQYLGARETLWLPGSLSGDDTDGHIDTLARFVDDTRVLAPMAPASHPDHEALRQNVQFLASRFEVLELPHPPIRMDSEDPDRLLPQSYANFLILNKMVLVPTYDAGPWDEQALSVLQKAFPGREVRGIPCQTLIEEGGAIHCLTMQEPQFTG